MPLDLTKYLVLKPEQFEKIKQYPWAVTPLGKQTFAGVPLEIQGATILWGKRNADRGQNYPETVIDIPCQQKFETLYILHSVFFEAAKGEPSFDIVLNYEGGKTQTDTILCGEDSKDWWVNDPNETLGPIGQTLDARLERHGQSQRPRPGRPLLPDGDRQQASRPPGHDHRPRLVEKASRRRHPRHHPRQSRPAEAACPQSPPTPASRKTSKPSTLLHWESSARSASTDSLDNEHLRRHELLVDRTVELLRPPTRFPPACRYRIR